MMRRALWTFASFALACSALGCSAPVQEGITGVRITVTYEDTLALTQIDVTGEVDAGGVLDGGITTFGPDRRPSSPSGTLSPEGETLVLLVEDVLAGLPFEARVDGLDSSGALVASGVGAVTLVRGEIVDVAIHLGAPSVCADAMWRDGIEGCDDGNAMDGDGCSSACEIEAGYECTHEPGGVSTCDALACDATTCADGCCSGGVCERALSGAVCGTEGAECFSCGTTGDGCTDGMCTCMGGAACGEGERCEATGCVCDPSTCAGCCDGNRCVAGDRTAQCGTGGNECSACAAGDECTGGRCTQCVMTCGGCCSGSICNPTSMSTCGENGGPCVPCSTERADSCVAGGCSCGGGDACDSGQACLGGRCVCTSTSCPEGCCNGDTCESRSVATCGTGGATCIPCNSTRANGCSPQGACTCNNGPGCSFGQTCDNTSGCVCDPGSCPNGCCDGNACRTISFTACGIPAGTCTACDAMTADSCTSGACRCGSGAACMDGQRCVDGSCRCDTISCDGCCQGGICRSGDTETACGIGGSTCSVCGGSDTCDGGVCSGCSTMCPTGCCSGSSCMPQSPTTCGTAGEACVACNSEVADQCMNGNCMCGTNLPCPTGQRCSGGSCICDSTSCPDGCCDGDTCRTSTPSTCGVGGDTCEDCDDTRTNGCVGGECRCGTGEACEQGQRCNGSGVCVCDAASCSAGCCNGTTCTTWSTSSCGSAGLMCAPCDERADTCASGACRCGSGQACAAGQHCDGGTCRCDSSSCSGCCTGPTGTCQAGTDLGACGSGGAMCVSCPGGACVDGVCTSACNNTNCAAGCCSGSSCINPPTAMACGVGAQACNPCNPMTSDRCNMSGQCRCGTSLPCGAGLQCMGSSCQCTPTSCPDGCCSGNVCMPRSLSSCGTAGGACMTCDMELADRCSSSGQCSCGDGGQQCDAGQRCFDGACICDASSCEDGCCDSAGNCHTSTVDSCGVSGSLCIKCDPVTSDQCMDGRCLCGGGSECGPGQVCEGGSCGCDPSTCAGCCDGETCRPGTDPWACGSGGSACAMCPGVQSCENGVCSGCTPTSCPNGCCSGSVCTIPQPNPMACGMSGAACTYCDPFTANMCGLDGQCHCGLGPACGDDYQCVAGACRCTPASCNGCCRMGICLPGTQAAACGTGGQMCLRCADGAQCRFGECECDPRECMDGCCDPLGACHTPGASNSLFCGIGGEDCDDCTTGGGPVTPCTGGNCGGVADPGT